MPWVSGGLSLALFVASLALVLACLCPRLKCELENGALFMNENNAQVAVESRRPFQVSLLSEFDEITRTFLKAARGSAHTSLQGYLDGRVAIGDAYFTRRAILLAIHDMKEELDAPLALQERVLAKLASLKVRPAPELRLYRDIATALLRMEVVVRFQANRDGDTKHSR